MSRDFQPVVSFQWTPSGALIDWADFLLVIRRDVFTDFSALICLQRQFFFNPEK